MAVDTTVQVTLPQMGESVTEGTVLEWHKQEGDRVEADETLVEISTDKVDAEVPAPASGTVVAHPRRRGRHRHRRHRARRDRAGQRRRAGRRGERQRQRRRDRGGRGGRRGGAPAEIVDIVTPAGRRVRHRGRRSSSGRSRSATSSPTARPSSRSRRTRSTWSSPRRPRGRSRRSSPRRARPSPSARSSRGWRAGARRRGRRAARRAADGARGDGRPTGDGAAPVAAGRRQGLARRRARRGRRGRRPRRRHRHRPRRADHEGRRARRAATARQRRRGRAAATRAAAQGRRGDARPLHGREPLDPDRDLVPHDHRHGDGRAAASSSRTPGRRSPSPTSSPTRSRWPRRTRCRSWRTTSREVDGKPHRVDDGAVNLGIAVDVEKKDGTPHADGAGHPRRRAQASATSRPPSTRSSRRRATNTLTADDLTGANVSLDQPGRHRHVASRPAAHDRPGHDRRDRLDRLPGRPRATSAR